MRRKLSIVVAVFCMVVVGLIVGGYFMEPKVSSGNEETKKETTNESVEEMP